jgi:hypothetical protein
LSEYSSDSDDSEVMNIVAGPATSDDTFESVSINTEIKNNFDQNEDVKVDSDNEISDTRVEENKNESVKIGLETKLKGGDQLITYDVSFISAFPFIVAKAV